MALRVARGLFRLWLILSVLWIGGVGVVTWWGEYVAPPRPGAFDDIPIPKPGEVPTFDPSKPYTEPRDRERWEAVRLASVIAFAPPVVILALGSALVWAFRGFR